MRTQRLVRVERAVRARWRKDRTRVLAGVTLPATGDRIGFMWKEIERAFEVAGRDLTLDEQIAMIEPLLEQFSDAELRELARDGVSE